MTKPTKYPKIVQIARGITAYDGEDMFCALDDKGNLWAMTINKKWKMYIPNNRERIEE